MQGQLNTVSQSIDFNDLGYLILLGCFCYILTNLNEFMTGQLSPIPTNTFHFLHTFWEIFTNSELEPKTSWPLQWPVIKIHGPKIKNGNKKRQMGFANVKSENIVRSNNHR